MTYKEFFKGKKIAVVGLGPHFEMIADIKFLIKSGADVSLYELRSEAPCRHILTELLEAGLTKYHFGIATGVKPARVGVPHEDVELSSSYIPDSLADSAENRAETISSNLSNIKLDLTEDLAAVDLIILSPDVPSDASFLAKVRQAGVRIEYPQTLFLKLAPPITLIGILGTCGKATVAHMVHSILKKGFEEYENQGVYYLDPDSPSALAHLKKAHKGDLVVARITSSLIPSYEEARVSPHVAVFTALTPGNGRSEAAFNMLQFQTYNNFIIGNDAVIDQIRENPVTEPRAKMLRTGAGIVPSDWNMRYRGAYERENVALALRTAELFKIPPDTTRGVVENLKGLKGRLELVKKVAGIEFYNNTAASVPTATLAALRAISENKNVVLIMGGAAAKGPGNILGNPSANIINESHIVLLENIPQYVSSVVLIPGSGTMSLRPRIDLMANAVSNTPGEPVQYHHASSIEDAVKMARTLAGKGNRVLFSPGFEAYGSEKSRTERGEKFVRAVRSL